VSFTRSVSRLSAWSALVRWPAIVASALVLSACGGSGSSSSGNSNPPPPASYTLGGTVSGATANGLVLANGSATVTVSSGATTFAFSSSIATGTAYAVTVQAAPAGLTCSVANGIGTIASANINNVAVTCTPQTFSLGGSVSGATADGLVLANGSATVTVASGATTFAFTGSIVTGTAYAVTVQTAPAGLTCSVANGTGTIGTANINNVVVTCSPQSYSLGGTISGLVSSGLVLANGTDRLTVASGATSFTMPAAVAHTSSYAVTVATQPTGLSCSVQNGTGAIGAVNVTTVVVSCSDQSYTLGGTVTGLIGPGLVLANGADTVTVPTNATAFTLPTAVAFGSHYAVTVATQPAGLTCSVSTGTGSAAMPAANVTTVAVVCSAQSYSLGGTISGLTTAGLVLANGTDTVTVPSGAPGFTLPTAVAFTTHYIVSVATQPTGLMCTVSSGSANMPAANVTGVMVTCSANFYTLGGSIAGLTSSGLVLTDGTDHLAVAANAVVFSMPTALAYNSAYTVSVETQPVGQLCSVTSGSSTMPAANVTSVQVTCSEWTWEGGSASVGQAGTYGTLGTAAAGNVPGARGSQMSWTDSAGHFWMFGGLGVDSAGTSGDLNDMWMYDPGTQQWTWEAGSNLANTASNYGTVPAPANLPGGRSGGMVWTDSSGRVWLFGGLGRDSTNTGDGYLNDLWWYDPTSQEWTWDGVSNTAGAAGVYGTRGTADPGNVPGARAYASTWTDSTGRLWLFGGVSFNGVSTALFNDLWVYDPTSREWTWVRGSSSTDQQGMYGTQGAPASSNTPSARYGAQGWRDSAGRFWLFGGAGYGVDATNAPAADVLNDLWMFDPTTQLWTWVGGTDVVATPGVYGTLGTPAAGNLPGGRGGGIVWTDSTGQVWLFGGLGIGVSAGGNGSLNDLWTFNLTTHQWTWVNGPNAQNVAGGVYGTLGTGAPGNQPGSRYGASGWTDATGHLWLFGGQPVPPGGSPTDFMTDLWKF
jgi:N-acetylneuraminic acid mutarotase/RNase P/RNase MRP subunit p29